MYKKSLKNLEQIGIQINEKFFTLETLDTPLLRSVTTPLESIDEKKGVKLTAREFLPAKLVQAIVEVGMTKSEKQFASLHKRFYEEEHLSAGMARVVAEVLEFVKLEKNKLLLTKKAQEFLSLSIHQRYIVLLNIMFGLNIGYFDGYQEALCVHRSSVIMLQFLRDKSREYREVDVYVAMLLELYPHLEEEIEHLEVELSSSDQFDIFVKIVQTRLFERLYLPLGLVDMKIDSSYKESDLFAKTQLLDTLITAKYAINKEMVLSKKLIKTFENEMHKNNLEINLFETIMFLFSQFAYTPWPPNQKVIDALMQRHALIGSLRKSYELFYNKLIEAVKTTYQEFTQLDKVGAKRDELVAKYVNMSEALAKLPIKPKPYATAQNLAIIPMFVFDILKIHYKIDSFSKDFILEIEKEFGEEFALSIGNFIMLLQQLEKDGRKLKKSKPHFEQSVKEFVQVYLMIVLELRSRGL